MPMASCVDGESEVGDPVYLFRGGTVVAAVGGARSQLGGAEMFGRKAGMPSNEWRVTGAGTKNRAKVTELALM